MLDKGMFFHECVEGAPVFVLSEWKKNFSESVKELYDKLEKGMLC